VTVVMEDRAGCLGGRGGEVGEYRCYCLGGGRSWWCKGREVWVAV